MKALLVLLALVACGPASDAPSLKGCEEEVKFDRPIVDGLGISSHIEWGESPEDVARRAQELQMWQELGPRVIRRDLTWNVLEPEVGQWNLSPVDRVLESTAAIDAELVALLDYGNPAYPPYAPDRAHPVDDPAHFAQYAQRIAQTYGDQLRMYEIWNEPNAGYAFWKPKEDPEAYAALVAATVPAIRAGDPEAFVALGGLFWPDLAFNTPGPEFLDTLLNLLPDLAGVDAVPVHPYRYPFTVPEAVEDHQGTMVDEICGARAQLDAAGLEDTELWVGELGWHTAPDSFAPGLSLEDQGDVLVRAAILSFAQGATQFGWYTTRDSGTDGEDQDQMFGLVGYDSDPLDGDQAQRKPAYHAFATLTRMLAEHTTIRDLSVQLGLDAQTYAYELSGGGEPVWVMWTDGPAGQVSASIDTSVVTVTAIDGSTERVLTGRRMMLEVSSSPVFVAFSG